MNYAYIITTYSVYYKLEFISVQLCSPTLIAILALKDKSLSTAV